MTTTEDRLRAATRAAAATVEPGSAPPLRLPTVKRGPLSALRHRGPHRLSPRLAVRGSNRRPATARLPAARWRHWVSPLAAAVAVIAVIAGAVGVGNAFHGRQQARAASALGTVPPFFVEVGGASGSASSGTWDAVIHATATGAVLATVDPPKPYSGFSYVAAGARDNRLFVLAACEERSVFNCRAGQPGQKAPGLFVLRLTPRGQPTLTPLAVPDLAVPGMRSGNTGGAVYANVAGMALSPDGTQVALMLSFRPQQQGQVRTISLATGRAREWAVPRSLASDLGAVSWTVNGHELAFQSPAVVYQGALHSDQVQVRLFSLATPGTALTGTTVVTITPVRGAPAWSTGPGITTSGGSIITEAETGGVRASSSAYRQWQASERRICFAGSGEEPSSCRHALATWLSLRNRYYGMSTTWQLTEVPADGGRADVRYRWAQRNRYGGGSLPYPLATVWWASPSGGTLIFSGFGDRSHMVILTGTGQRMVLPVQPPDSWGQLVW